jgi:hypothetical protein
MEATQSIEGTGPGKTLRSCVTTAKDVRQHRLRQPLGLLRRVPTCVLQTVGDAVHEAGVIRRLAAEVRLLLLVRDEEGDLLGSSPLVHLDQACVIRRDQRSVPKTDLGGSQLAIGKLQQDAAHVLVGEEVRRFYLRWAASFSYRVLSFDRGVWSMVASRAVFLYATRPFIICSVATFHGPAACRLTKAENPLAWTGEAALQDREAFGR